MLLLPQSRASCFPKQIHFHISCRSVGRWKMEPRYRGGLWDCPRAAHYSGETQKMLELMMQESRLTRFQQRQISKQVSKGGSLPLTCHPTSSPAQPKVDQALKAAPRQPRTSQRRSAAMCSAAGNYTREQFRAGPTRDLEKEKEHLQNLFATGQKEPKANEVHKPSDDGEVKDRFQEVLDEIEDRKLFLEEMSSLGHGHLYHNIINTEISQKIRELELIDKAHNATLKSALLEEQVKMD
ncbi:UPF0193 protein EVG1 [Denticeps clupeoides]|uniref:Uncharacterized protein n=1 Tax=Denticeps clupeoides TaxID=299321 RepID=A0AAY4ACG4_9TELE|nr:UPF0193 protein EVG1 [Denticeps clupeoides]